jgi:predicted transcriptional regulator
MKTLSLKLDKSIFEETEKILEELKKPRNRYINEAVEYYNKIQRRKLTEEKLKKESEMVREDSIRVLKEFEKLEYGD